VTAAGALRGLKDTRAPMLLALLAYWGIGLPTGWLLAFGLGRGGPGLWTGLVLGLAAAAALLALRFARHAGRAW
jgi:MATE family multidrug resistance protein